jgi:hypothetical protein
MANRQHPLGLQGNLQLVVNVAKEFTEQLGITALIELFESFSSYHGLYFFLGSRMATTENPEEHFKYIEASVKTGEAQFFSWGRQHAAHIACMLAAGCTGCN